MQIKNFKYILSIASFVVIGSSCSTIVSIGKSTKKWSNEVRTKVNPIIKKDTVAPKTGNTTLVRFTLPSLKSKKPKVKKLNPLQKKLLLLQAILLPLNF
jgi:hypothetical protein